MDGEDFRIRYQRDDGECDDRPTAGIEDEQRDESGEQAQSVEFCQPRMRGRILSKFRVADKNHDGFR